MESTFTVSMIRRAKKRRGSLVLMFWERIVTIDAKLLLLSYILGLIVKNNTTFASIQNCFSCCASGQQRRRFFVPSSLLLRMFQRINKSEKVLYVLDAST
jgi:hypothetical protein